jgi:hypothetical protein
LQSFATTSSINIDTQRFYFLQFNYIMKMQLKRYIALFMAFVLLLSNLGISTYLRYCGCENEWYSSVFIETKGDCCKHHSSEKITKEAKSCCQISKKQSAETAQKGCKVDKGNCCDTKVTYTHFDGDATATQSSAELVIAPTSPALPPTVQKAIGIAAPTLKSDACLQLSYKPTVIIYSPPAISGRERLQAIQIMRC